MPFWVVSSLLREWVAKSNDVLVRVGVYGAARSAAWSSVVSYGAICDGLADSI